MNIKAILITVVIFFIVLAALLLPGGKFNKSIAGIYAGIGNAVYPVFIDNDKRIIECEVEKHTEDNHRLKVKIGNLEHRTPDGRILARVLRINVRTFAYIPTAFLIALIAVTPVPFFRRLTALISGFIIYQLFIIIKMIAFLFQSSPKEFAVADLPGLIRTLVDAFCDIFILKTEMGTSLALSVLIWVIVTFRLSDIEKIRKYFNLTTQKKAK